MFIDIDLKNYIEMDMPNGALMVTGEWGSGKSYYINEQLCGTDSDYFCVKVSLFGLAEYEEVETRVRKEFASLILKEKIPEFVQNITGKYDVLKSLNKISRAFIGEKADVLDPEYWLDFDLIGNKINNKKVVMIFDDLERVTADISLVLGYINNLVENKHIPVIILSNEEVILRDEEKMQYYIRAKEKVVQRTVAFTGNYKDIITKYLAKYNSDEYQKFLNTNSDMIVELFTQSNGIHNLRSLFAAIQNFEIIFQKLKTKAVPSASISKFMTTYFSYSIVARTELFDDKKTLPKRADVVRKLYPSKFDDMYLLPVIDTWILHGKYDEVLVEAELDEWCYFRIKKDSDSFIYNTGILDIDDDIIKKSFHNALSKAYNGELSFREYIRLIDNICFGEKIGYHFCADVEWSRISEGIENVWNKIKDNPKISLDYVNWYFETDDYPQEAKDAVLFIKALMDENRYLFAKNRALFLEDFNQASGRDWWLFQNRVYDCFDINMAEAFLARYMIVNNHERVLMQCRFISFWKDQENVHFLNVNKKSGFGYLAEKLVDYSEQLKKEEQFAAAYNMKNFSEELDSLITDQEG